MNAFDSERIADGFINSLERQHGPPSFEYQCGPRVWTEEARTLVISRMGAAGRSRLLIVDVLSDVADVSLHEIHAILRTSSRGAFEVSTFSVSESELDVLGLVDISVNAMRRRLKPRTLVEIQQILK